MELIQDNKIKYARQNKYYENNKESIQRKNRVKVKCEICNAIVNKSCLSRHEKSIKCLAHVFIEIDNPDSDKVFLLKDL